MPEIDLKDFLMVATEAGVLFRARKKLGLTQQEVADRAGITLRQYQRYEGKEKDLSSSSFKMAVSVLKALEIDIKAFATYDSSLFLIDPAYAKEMEQEGEE